MFDGQDESGHEQSGKRRSLTKQRDEKDGAVRGNGYQDAADDVDADGEIDGVGAAEFVGEAAEEDGPRHHARPHHALGSRHHRSPPTNEVPIRGRAARHH